MVLQQHGMPRKSQIPFEVAHLYEFQWQMFVVGAQIITKYTGSFRTFVEERIFKPLNMSSSTYSVVTANQSGKATQSWTGDGRRVPWWTTPEDEELNSGPGGVITNVEDLVRIVNFDPVSCVLTRVIRTSGYGLSLMEA